MRGYSLFFLIYFHYKLLLDRAFKISWPVTSGGCPELYIPLRDFGPFFVLIVARNDGFLLPMFKVNFKHNISSNVLIVMTQNSK